MAEYYPLLAKAVASLPNSSPESRKIVYERARKALIGQLRTLHPPVPDDDIERESVALDRAVERLETELAAPPAPSEAIVATETAPVASGPAEPALSKPAPSPSTPAPSTPASAPLRKPASSDEKPTLARFPVTGGALGPSASKPVPPLRTKVAPPKVASSKVVAKRPVNGAAPAGVEPGSAAPQGDPVARVDPAPDLAASVAAPAPVEAEVAAPEPTPRVAPTRSAVEPPIRAKLEPQRPIAPQPPEPKGPRRPLWIIPVGVGLVVLIVAVAAYKLRDRPETLARATPTPTTQSDSSKIVERVGGSSEGDTGSKRVSDQAPTARQPASDSASAPAPAPTSPAPNPAAPVAGRAAMLVEAPDEQNKVKTYLGTVVWRLDNVSEGQNQAVGLAVRADIDLPDDRLKASVIFQKNTDPSLPASHTMKVRFTVLPGSGTGNVSKISVPQMRREDSSTGDPLDGVTVPIVENSFLVGLSPGNAETANLQLLRGREWIDIPIFLANNRIAKLTFEKTDAGQRDIQEAVAAWSKP